VQEPTDPPDAEPASKAAARLPWLLAGWGLSSVCLIAALLLLLLTKAAAVGVVLFILGALGTAVVSIGLLRTRASVNRSTSA
jgi:hypothetical protein